MALVPRYRLLETGDRRLLENSLPRLLEHSYEPYLGFAIFPFRANWAEEPSDGWVQSMTTLDNVTGLHLTRSHVDVPIARFEILLTLEGRTEINDFRGMIRDMKGRSQRVWVPTWVADLKLVADITATTMAVESVGYSDAMYPHANRKYVAIIDHTGLIMPRKITGASDNGTQETLSIDASVDNTVLANASLISFLLLARLASDSVRLRWIGSDLAEARVAFVELPLEVPT